MNNQASAAAGITGRKVLFALVAFFVTVSAVNAVMIYDALSTFGGIEPDSYRNGLAYNQRIADEAAQTQLGWSHALTLDDATSALKITLKDRAGSALNGLQLTATIGRPATNAFDRSVAFEAAGDGTYSVLLPGLAGGRWTINIAARQNNAPDAPVIYQSRTRLWKQS